MLEAAWLQGISGGVAAIATCVIAWLVQRYNKKRDRLSVIHLMWQQQQDFNLEAVGSFAHARACEQMVYGTSPNNDEEKLALRYCLFYFINRIKILYDARQADIIDHIDFESHVAPTVRLLIKQRGEVEYLLDHRGYDMDFANELKAQFVGGVAVLPDS